MSPPLAVAIPEGRGYRDPVTGQVVPSVTTVLRLLAKDGLDRWKLRTVAEAAVHHRRHLEDLRARYGDEEAARRLAQAADRVAGRAAERGTAVHCYAEAWAKGEALPEPAPEHEGYLRAFEAFVAGWRPRFLGAEATVWAKEAGYAGTLDAWAVVEVEGRRHLIDYKTSKAVYPEAALQLAALANAPEVVHPDGAREPAPRVEGGLVVRLGADGGYAVHAVNVGPTGFAWQAFARLVGVWWLFHAGPLVSEALPVPQSRREVNA
jgi:hypothetical protein